ncbi:M81 family metallopeptidase [Siminovitchia sp. 179-K 8D1 HS]|uniref:M81 family metallopeptidase n=1 Tax=Siminovitchia sp. 179-K 8D1 HS TaxID=3142385 RepID=UPI0039A3925F
MKIAIGQVAHETNTFASTPTTVETFKRWEWCYGKDIIHTHKGVQDYLGGMIYESEQQQIELIPVFSAFAYPSGIITKETYTSLERELFQSVKSAGNLDAVCLAMHGAGVAENTEDLEGSLLKALRAEIGYDIPIVVTLDLHGNITQTMVSEADLLLGVNFYPHTDSFDRGREAIDLAKKMVSKSISPVMYLESLPLIIPTSTTNKFPAKEINEACWKYEEDESVIDCTFFHGFPYTDISKVGVSVLVTADGDETKAKLIAEKVGTMIWDIRDEFIPNILSPAEGIERALQMEGGPIIINETSDNPGGGTPGDGTYLLKAMIDAQLTDSCFGYIYDPEVANKAHQAGVGANIHVRLGGKTDNLHGEPLEINAYVKSLTDGVFCQSSPMWRGLKNNLDKSARLVVGGLDIIVCSVKSQVLDEQIFLLHGIDVTKYKIVALKSSQHFRAAFEPIGREIITVDSPGLTTLNFTTFDYKKLKRPIYPLDYFERKINAEMAEV